MENNTPKIDPTKLQAALEQDLVIDIVTTGAKTGRQRETEIWFWNLEGRIIICGTPGKQDENGRYKQRDWLANIIKTPHFQFCFKESLKFCLPAEGIVIEDQADRHAIMTAPKTRWYREQGYTVEQLVNGSPIIEVRFLSPFVYLNNTNPQ